MIFVADENREIITLDAEDLKRQQRIHYHQHRDDLYSNVSVPYTFLSFSIIKNPY